MVKSVCLQDGYRGITSAGEGQVIHSRVVPAAVVWVTILNEQTIATAGELHVMGVQTNWAIQNRIGASHPDDRPSTIADCRVASRACPIPLQYDRFRRGNCTALLYAVEETNG